MTPTERPILLVEDNINDAELARVALRHSKIENEVIVARHGGEALDYLERQGKYAGQECRPPLVILLDLKMPLVDGLETLARIKQHPLHRRVPVVMLTTSREQADVARSYELGANAYVVKPVVFPDFVETMGRLGRFWVSVNEAAPIAE